VLVLVLFLCVLAAGGVLFRSLGSSTDSASSALTVRYRAGSPATSAVAAPWLEIINTSEQPVDLADVTVRYYYTAEGDTAYGSNCVQTALGCSHVTQRTAAVETPTEKADHYLVIGFTSGTGTLAPGGTSQGIGLQLFRVDHARLNQSNDRSFDAGATTYAPSKWVTAYLEGDRVWGEDPEGASPPREKAAAPALPKSVLFDDFAYTGPHDPALEAHGWEARDGEGGPGVKDTWSASGVGFPATGTSADGEAAKEAADGQSLRLTAHTDGTRSGTRQSEFHTAKPTFLTGTLVARVHFGDDPTSGRDGDHIAESLFAISPDHTSPKYSELDYEYMPNGGWGSYGPRLDTTSWRDSTRNDRVTRSRTLKLSGWHTLAITAVDGRTTYAVDGDMLFTSGSRHFPRERMTINMSAWFIDLPFRGVSRTWAMRVDWLYYASGAEVSPRTAEKTVTALASAGLPYVDTLPAS
jgi:hypothetical protein